MKVCELIENHEKRCKELYIEMQDAETRGDYFSAYKSQMEIVCREYFIQDLKEVKK